MNIQVKMPPRTWGNTLAWVSVLLLFLAVVLVKAGVISDGHQKFADDCASRGGHAVFEPYTTCFDSSGKPEGVPYR